MKTRTFKRLRFLAITAVCMALLIGADLLLAPAALKKVTVRTLTDFLGRPVTVEKLDLDLIAMSVTAHGVRVGEPSGGDILSADTLSAGIELLPSVKGRMFVLKEISLVNPIIHVTRNSKGMLNFADLLLLDWPKAGFSVQTLRLVNGTVVYRDLALPTPFSTTLSRLTVTADDFSTSPEHKNTYAVSAVTERGEGFSSSGSFRFNPMSASGVVAFENVAVDKYSPYLAEGFDVVVANGTLTAQASFDVDLARERFTLRLRDGTIAARSLDVREVRDSAPVFGFEGLVVSGANADLIRQKIAIASIAMTGGTAALSRRPDGSFNVQHIVKPAGAVPAVTPANTAAWKITVGEIRLADFAAVVDNVVGRETLHWKELRLSAPAVQTNPFAASVGEITLNDGRLVFTDSSFQPPVTMALTDLNVRIGAFSSDDPRSASVAVRARIDTAARLQVSGESNPIAATGSSSIRGLLQNVDLVPLSQYAAKYLGYDLAAGALSLDSTVVLQNRRLVTRNRIQIDRLTLGAKSASKDATDLPVPLALALLKDLSGTITMNIPIEISLGEPGFEPQKAIIDALLHPLAKIAAFPFETLGAQVGGGGDELGFQKFASDSAELIPLETVKLDTILKGMLRWPVIVLDIEGSVDGLFDSGDLQLLATQRARAVAEYLAAQGTVAPGRFFLMDRPLQKVLRDGSRVFLRLQAVTDGDRADAVRVTGAPAR